VPLVGTVPGPLPVEGALVSVPPGSTPVEPLSPVDPLLAVDPVTGLRIAF
jgi:hypothetical protein